MAPRPRRVLPNTQQNQNSVVHEPVTQPETSTASNLQGSKKRTLATADPITPALTAMHTPTGPQPNKRARDSGPSHGRPMQLRSMDEGRGEIEREQLTATTINSTNGKGKARAASRRTSSVVPTRRAAPVPVQRVHPLPHQHFDSALTGDGGNDADSDDSGAETEKEWLDESDLAKLALRFPDNVSEAMAIERPSWQVPSDAPVAASGSAGIGALGPSSHVSDPTSQKSGASVGAASFVFDIPASQGGSEGDTSSVIGLPASQWVSGGDAADLSLDPELSQGIWPSTTDLVFNPGTTKLTLNLQRGPLRAILHDAFEKLRAFLLLNNSFPDATTLPMVIKNCLITAAAESHYPSASDIRERLTQDDKYMDRLSRLPRARIPIYRSDVKERCAALVQATFLVAGSPPNIAQIVSQQLSKYFYTFPTSPNNDTVLKRTKPYRNPRVIQVIRDLYFSGGIHAFVTRFGARFPTSEDEAGMVVHEVPVAMVALVSTALYAAIYEWRTGFHHPAEFSANSYLDVYVGHIQTMDHIFKNRNGSFHRMMADIYAQASKVEVTAVPGVAIAELDLDALDD